MCARPGTMLLLVLFVLVTGTNSTDIPFNVTFISVPKIVPVGQGSVTFECRYEGNFTIFTWFRGNREFFRYKPNDIPSVKIFPVLGVDKVENEFCGPTYCTIRLTGLSELASGQYRCDIEREIPPYKFATKNAYMNVTGRRSPIVEGLFDEYFDGDIMQAYCRAETKADLRWYINGNEIKTLRGSQYFRYVSNRRIFMGTPPMILVQCSEVSHGKVIGSGRAHAYWLGYLDGRWSTISQAANTDIAYGFLFMCAYITNNII